MKATQSIQWLSGFWKRLSKYQYALLVLLIGVGLMLLPQSREASKPATDKQAETVSDLETELQSLLRQIDGVGEVSVLLTLETGPSYEYQTNSRTKTSDSGSEQQEETVLVASGGTEAPLTVRMQHPVYKGAVVVCQGADRATVRLSIIEAVSSLTGLGSDKITVIKMKS